MRKLMLPLVAGLLFSLLPSTIHAQFANVQVIHNAPDPAVSVVDIYLNGASSAALDDFTFREASAFLQVPAGVPLTINIAPGTSTSAAQAIANIPLPALTAGQNYVIVATGVLVPAGFDQTVNGAAIGFSLEILTPAQTTGTGGNVDIVVAHGATDAPAVDVLANGGATPLIDNLAYGDFSGYASVPAAEYVLEVTPANDNSTIVATYYADLSTLGGGSAVVFASGFLNPATNQGGPAFGLFAALADGTVLPLTAVGSARAQVIHNAADPGAATVDVYVNWISDSLKLDDFAFRTATPFVSLPTGYPVTIAIAPPTSTSSADAIATFTPTLMDGETYAVVANGVLDPASFAANPDGASTAFTLLLEAGVREAAAMASDVDIKVLHGATDAPSVGVNANGNAVVPTASYTNFTGYLSVPDAAYRIDVTGANAPATLVAPFFVDITGLNGGATLVFASGFLDPAANQGGPAFGLFAALADGTVVPLTAVGTARGQVIHNAADPAAATVDVYVNMLADTLVLNDFDFRTATPFVDLPSGYPIQIAIAGGNSTGIGDAIATIPATLMDGETYAIVANGVLDPASFAANPDGASTAFTLLLEGGVREAAANASDVDIKVLHGATDAPSVGVNANGNAVVPTASYTNFTGYLSVPDAEYRIDVTGANAPATLVAPFYVDITGLDGGATLVFASGFLDPAANQGGPAFGLFAAFADGTVAPLTPVGTARGQVIHNAADPAAATVDIYVNMLADTLVLNDFNFRTATPFVDLPTGYPIKIAVAGPNSTGIGDAIATIPATLMDGESYHLIANGVLNPAAFAANPDAIATGFEIIAGADAQEAAADPANVDVRVFHGATDAPTVDVLASGNPTPIVDDAPYRAFTGYLPLPPAAYTLVITPGNDNSTTVATFLADVSTLTGGAGIVLATGFLDPAANQDGAAFGLLLVLPDGTAILLDNTTAIDEQLTLNNGLLKAYPNPFQDFATLTYEMETPGALSMEVFDAAGRVAFRRNWEFVGKGAHTTQLSANELSAGVHTVIFTAQGTRSIQRVVVVK